MSVEEESTSCYCLLDSASCHLLLQQPGCYALVGEPLTQGATKRLKLAAFGSAEAASLGYSLRVYCVDDTPHAFQVGAPTSHISKDGSRRQRALAINANALTNPRTGVTTC